LEGVAPGLSLAISTEPSHPPLALLHWPPPGAQQNDRDWPQPTAPNECAVESLYKAKYQ
jgi:hypothetical protein